MLDFSWQELLVTGVVALVVIGPKELPGMMRSAGRFVRRARMVAGDFYQQFEDLADAAELEDIQKKAFVEADAIEPVLSDDEARALASGGRGGSDGGEGQHSAPLIISKEECHTTPDRAFTLLVAREDDEVTVSFKGYDWRTHGDALVEDYALVGQSFGSEVAAARRLVDDLRQDKAYIVIQSDPESGEVQDVWVRLQAFEADEVLPEGQKMRVWSGALTAHD